VRNPILQKNRISLDVVKLKYGPIMYQVMLLSARNPIYSINRISLSRGSLNTQARYEPRGETHTDNTSYEKYHGSFTFPRYGSLP
jgi:hypothetical protein